VRDEYITIGGSITLALPSCVGNVDFDEVVLLPYVVPSIWPAWHYDLGSSETMGMASLAPFVASRAAGLAHGRCEPGPGARVNPGCGVLRLTPPQSQKAQSPTAHPMGGRPGQPCTSRGCAACPHAWLTARAAPVSSPPRNLRSNPHPQHGLCPAYTLPLAEPRLAHVVSVSGLVLFWSQKTGFGPENASAAPFSEGGALKAAGCAA
jgi:hypothetical protein